MAPKTILISCPPYAACRYGCAGCCAAPIGVFWLAGLTGIFYGLIGGPTGAAGVSWLTLTLGVTLWAIAVTWAYLVVRGYDADRCAERGSTLCRRIAAQADEPDPLEEVRKARMI